MQYYICQCLMCGLRYPVAKGNRFAVNCPSCHAEIKSSSEYITETENTKWLELQELAHPPLLGFLDNVRSAWNVGSMFRTADGLGVQHLYLGGITSTPDNPKVAKTSLGAEFSVPWSHHPNGLEAIVKIKEQGYRLWALEGHRRSIAITEAYLLMEGSPIILITGNETFGVDPEIIDKCERLIYIPMMGAKRSYNVAVAFGIACYLLSINQASKFLPKDR